MTEPPAKHPANSVANALRDQLRCGNYKLGDWLPTERALAEDLGIGRSVVRDAINELIRGGLVTRRSHSRPIVASMPGEFSEALPKGEAPACFTSSFIALLMWGGDGMEPPPTTRQRIFWGMNRALTHAGHHAVFVDLGVAASENEIAAREAEQLRRLLSLGFGGAVFYSRSHRRNRALVREVAAAIPLVAIDRRIDFVDTDYVGVDNSHAMYAAVKHLIDRGHRRIAYVTKNEHAIPVQDRIQGYKDAVRDADLDELILSIPSRGDEQGWAAIDTVFQLPPEKRPTAAAAFNDSAAMDFAKRLERLGLVVPRDIALTGFDDIELALPSGTGLTTMNPPYETIGQKAAELLLRRLEAPSAAPLSIELPAELIVRASSAAL